MKAQEYAQTGTYAQAPETKPERESIVQEFDWAITDLDKVVDELYQRLSPVLAPEYEYDYDGPDSASSQPAPSISDARARLHHLHALTANLRRMIDRLEV